MTQKILWTRVLFFLAMHIAAAYGLLLMFNGQAKWGTVAFGKCHYLEIIYKYVACALWLLSGMSITAGAHRLWAHRTYTACCTLRIVLMVCNCIAFQVETKPFNGMLFLSLILYPGQ